MQNNKRQNLQLAIYKLERRAIVLFAYVENVSLNIQLATKYLRTKYY